MGFAAIEAGVKVARASVSRFRRLKSNRLDSIVDNMSWHVQYMIPSGETVEFHATPEKAIEAACTLIDAGLEVFGIGTGPLSDSISKTEIARIYSLWLPAAKPAI